MESETLLGQLGFVAKVTVVSAVLAIAFKTLAPSLPIPQTSVVSLAIVLTPSTVIGLFLSWRLFLSWQSRTLDHADSSHPGRD